LSEKSITCPFCRKEFLHKPKNDNEYLEELIQIKKPLLLLAGPGTGKTHAMAYKMRHLIKKEGVPRDDILVITFTNEAAISMRKKISSEGDKSTYIEPELQPQAIWTMHKLGNMIIREHYAELGLDEATEVVPSEPLRQILIRDSAQLAGAKRVDAKATILCRQQGECQRTDNLKCKICVQYEKLLRESRLIDHDDQIFLACKLLHARDDILRKIQQRAKYLLVDEYQDINYAQWDLIRQLTKGNTKNLFVVGDDYQSIYSFRGGKPTYIKNFVTDYAPDAVVKPLLTSWRCPEKIFKGAFHMVNKYYGDGIGVLGDMTFANKSSVKIKTIEFDYQNSEATYIATTVKGLGPSQDVLILIPWLEYAEPIKRALRSAHINYSCEYDLEETDTYLIHILLNWLFNTSDDLSLRLLIEEIIDKGASDIPAKQSEIAGTEETKRKREDAFKEISSYWIERKDRYSLYKKIKILGKQEQFKKLAEIITGLRKASKGEASDFIVDMMTKLKVWRQLAGFREENRSICEEIKSLCTPPGEIGVRIMKRNKAKGLQADYVFLVGLENGVWPMEAANALEKAEDSRLLYVSMTRAKKALYLFCSKARERKITKKAIAGRSEFIDAIPQEYIDA
jgi:DNA helicase-2/ATP-dependent DNA helicase PcrA